MSGYSNYEDVMKTIEHPKNKDCKDTPRPSVACQCVDVSVPVAIIPFARVKDVRIHCKGKTEIHPGETNCNGKKGGVCCFTMSQTFCVEIPVCFGANVDLGDTYVDCLSLTSGNTTTDYDDEEV